MTRTIRLFSTLGLLLGSVCLPVSAFAAKVDVQASAEKLSPELLKELRSHMADESKPETAFEARRQARRGTEALKSALNSRGYYDPTIEMAINTEGDLTPVILLDPGKKFRISGITVVYDGVAPRAADQTAALKAASLSVNDPAIPAEVINSEREIVTELRAQGYAFVEALERTVTGDRDAGELEIIYNIRSGNRVRFGGIIYPEDSVTKVSYLKRLEPFKPDDLYDPSELAVFGSRLDETRIYSIANARLAPEPSGFSSGGDAVHDVIVSLKTRKKNTIALGATLATDTGFGLSGELTRRNLSRRGDTLVATANIAELEQSLDLKWRRPNEFGYGRGLILSSELINEMSDAYDLQSFSLGAGVEVASSPRFSYGYGVVGAIVKEEDDFGERDLQLLSVYGSARVDRADSVLKPTKGWRADLRVEPSISFGGEQSQFVQSSGQIRGYYPIGKDNKLVLAGRVKAGTVWGAGVADLPTQNRFFAGGGGSVRGYSYQAIGPRSADDDPIGGRSLLETSIEARWQVRSKIGVAAFIDGGNVTSRETPTFGDLRFGAGAGIRYDTPAGPLRIDIATPLDKTDNDDPVQVYIALGQSF